MRNRMMFVFALASLPAMTSAQDMGSAAPAYCSELKRVTALAMTRERFAALAGKVLDPYSPEATYKLAAAYARVRKKKRARRGGSGLVHAPPARPASAR